MVRSSHSIKSLGLSKAGSEEQEPFSNSLLKACDRFSVRRGDPPVKRTDMPPLATNGNLFVNRPAKLT
jgi:hypothetical protein